MYSNYYLIPTRYKRQLHDANDTNNNIQGQGRTIGGTWERSNQEFDASVARKRVMFSNEKNPRELTSIH